MGEILRGHVTAVSHDLTLRSLRVPAAASASEKAVFHQSSVTFLSSEVQQEVAQRQLSEFGTTPTLRQHSSQHPNIPSAQFLAGSECVRVAGAAFHPPTASGPPEPLDGRRWRLD